MGITTSADVVLWRSEIIQDMINQITKTTRPLRNLSMSTSHDN